jgi:hypothetical protein
MPYVAYLAILAIPSPGTLNLDCVLTCVRNYYVGSFSAGTWMSLDQLSDCAIIRPGGNHMIPLKNLYSSHDTACSLFDRDQFEEGGRVVMAAFGHIKDIMHAEHPRTVGAIFDLSMFLRLRGRPEIANVLIRQFASLAGTVPSSSHPLSRIFSAVARLDDEDIEAASRRVWTCALDRPDEALGPLHYTSLRPRTEFIQIAEVKTGTDHTISSLRRLLGRCKTRLGMADSRSLKLLDTMAELALEHGDLQLADELAEDLIACDPLAVPWSRFVDIWIAGLFVKARVQKCRGQAEAALATIQEAIDLNVSQWGWNYALTLKYLVYQETWLADANEQTRAAEVKRFRLEILGSRRRICSERALLMKR